MKLPKNKYNFKKIKIKAQFENFSYIMHYGK